MKMSMIRFQWPFPIVRQIGSSEAVVFGRRVFGSDASKTTRSIHRLFSRADTLVWEFKWRYVPRHQYNIIRTDLDPGYYDEDELILHGAMAMLCRYIECNKGPDELARFSAELRDCPDTNAPDGLQDQQADRQDEAVAIYKWWKIEKPRDEAHRDQLSAELYGSRRARGAVMTSKPTSNPHLCELVIPDDDKFEDAMRQNLRALDEKIEADEQSMLHRLIDIRRSLWT